MLDRVSILHLGEGESRRAWRSALAERVWEGGTPIKRDNGRAVWKASMLGSTVSVKCRPAERLRVLLRLTDSARAVRAAKLLRRAGIETPRVFVHARVGPTEVLVNEWLEGPTLLERILKADTAERIALCRTAGALVGTMLEHTLLNRDCKPSNIIVTAADAEHLALVDIGGVRRPIMLTAGGYMDIASRMLAALFIEPRGLGCEPEDVAIDVAVEAAALNAVGVGTGATRREFCERVSGLVRQRIESHGDATPKVNPLEPPTA